MERVRAGNLAKGNEMDRTVDELVRLAKAGPVGLVTPVERDRLLRAYERAERRRSETSHETSPTSRRALARRDDVFRAIRTSR